ncbi:MAG: sigma-70 family RNA polymerase sigma factor [Planctomycetota bacterium]
MAGTTRKTLLLRARGGEPESWHELVRMYSPFIRTQLRRSRLPEHDLDDLTQDILLQLHRKICQFDHNGRPGAFRRWLRVVTLNRARAYLRSRPNVSRVSISEIEPLADDKSSASRSFERDYNEHVIRQLVSRLASEFTESTMDSFKGYVLEQRDPKEVSAELGVSLQSVYIAKSRVLKRLRQMAVEYEAIP